MRGARKARGRATRWFRSTCAPRRAVALALALAAALAISRPGSSNEFAYGRHLAGECTACHKLDGTDKGIPAIIGWDIEAFIATLRYYKTGERNNPAMVSVAMSLDESQMRALAVYFASLRKK